MALVAYESFQVATYGALGPAAQAEAAAHLGVNWPWWAWALVIWAVVTVLGLARVEVAGRVLAVLTAAEIVIVLAETISGLASPAGGHLDLGALSPSTLTASGAGALGVLAVIAGLAFVGFEQSPVLGEEARNPRRTIPGRHLHRAGRHRGAVRRPRRGRWRPTPGRAHVAAAAAAQGPGLLYGLSSSGALAQAAQAAVHDLAVRRRAVVSQRDLAVHVRAVPRGGPACRAVPDQPVQHPPGRVPASRAAAPWRSSCCSPRRGGRR